MSNKIAIIDCDSVCFSIFNPNKVLDEYGVPVKIMSEAGNMVYKTIEKTENELISSANEVMNNILTKGEFTHYIGFIKGSNTIKDKLKVNPLYKQNRSREQPKFWKFVKEYLIKEWKVIEVNDIECDDAVNITRLHTPNSHIVAIDGDLLGLQSFDCPHYNWRKNIWITINKDKANYDLWKNIISGTHNNTKGIPGKGEKYAEKVLSKTNQAQDVLTEYIKYFGEQEGIKEFYSNYICCSTLTNHKEFEYNLKNLESHKPILYEYRDNK
jgi:hypothetical protein